MKEREKNNYNFYYDNDVPIREEILLRCSRKRISNANGNKKKKRKKEKKKVLLVLFFIICFGSLSFSLYKLYRWHLDNKNISEITKELEEITNIEEVPEVNDGDVDTETETEVELVNKEEVKPESDYWYYIKFPLIQVNFDELMAKNSDTIAWIQVNNTNINYPVVQYKDNSYYLTRSYDKKWNSAGWVFADYRNSGNFNDKNTIIYAHSRLDDTMFGTLSETLKPKWHKNKDNHIINISTPTENSLWQIFSVYTIEAESYYITTDFRSDDDYLKFLNTIRARSRYNFDVTLSANDSILTLSTCRSETERTVLHAKKIKKSARDS